MNSCAGPAPPVASRLSRPFARRGKFRASSFRDGPHHDLDVCKVALLLAALGVLPAADAMRGRKEIRVINSLHLFERFCFRDGEEPAFLSRSWVPICVQMLCSACPRTASAQCAWCVPARHAMGLGR
jgi:hypothetical protein